MKPELPIPSRAISEKRPAAARANGAKSRGPVTAQGRANSSRNSLSHGLRAKTHGVVDRESADRLSALLASYTRSFQPQSERELRLAETMALTYWRQTCLRTLETAVLNGEVRRLKCLTPDEDPVTLVALAVRALSGDGCSLNLINRLESRCDRQYYRAFDRLTALQTRGVQSNEKVKMIERTQQVAENTPPRSATTHRASPAHLTVAARS